LIQLGDALQSKSRPMKAMTCMILLVVIVTVGFSAFGASPCYATALPDSTPTIEDVNVYRNLLETGDWLILIYHNIPYATPPSEPVWQTFIWRLYATDNVTEIGAVLPYAFNDNGYGYNLSSMYFTAAEVTAANMTWGSALNLRLSGNPVAFTTPPQYNFNLVSGDYSTLTVTADVQSELAARILAIADDLNVKWSLATAYSLIQEGETGTALSMYGEAFFRGAIYGLQGLCPSVFAYVVSDMDLTPRTWTTTYITTLKNQYVGTWVDTAKNGLDALFGTSYSLSWLMLSLIAAIVVLIFDVMVAGDAWLGVMDASVVLILTTRLGFFDLGYLGLIAAVAVMFVSARIWGVFK
jgi:hypothetical protein